MDADPDIDLPVIAVAPIEVRRGRPILSWLRGHQGIFFPILLLEGVSLHASGVRRVVTAPGLRWRWIEIGLLSIRLLGYPAVVFVVLSPGIAAGFFAVQLGICGVYMGLAFAPHHKGMPLVPRDLELDFLRKQVLMSRDIRGNRFLDTAMGGLNYQIEHHLFPSMPRPHLRRNAPLIAAHCRAHDVPYTQVGLFASYAIVVRYINRVGLGERDVFSCPLMELRHQIAASGEPGRTSSSRRGATGSDESLGSADDHPAI